MKRTKKRKPLYSYTEFDKDGNEITIDRYQPSWHYRPSELMSTFSDHAFIMQLSDTQPDDTHLFAAWYNSTLNDWRDNEK